MSGRETATVETLTASVKTLMVGARQVTLTIFKQLDVVGYHEMTPFGRVSPQGHETDWATLVGRRNVSGELVRARVPVTREAILQHTGMGAHAREAAEYRAGTSLSPVQTIRRDVVHAVSMETIELRVLDGGQFIAGRDLCDALRSAYPDVYGDLSDGYLSQRVAGALSGIELVQAKFGEKRVKGYMLADVTDAAAGDIDYAPQLAAEAQAKVDEATAPYTAVAEVVAGLPLIVLAGLA
jgi:hypothetical protein